MSKSVPFVASLGIVALSIVGCSSEYGDDFPTTAIMNGGDWRDEVIYQVIIDRFADGDINNNHRVMTRTRRLAITAATIGASKRSSTISRTWA